MQFSNFNLQKRSVLFNLNFETKKSEIKCSLQKLALNNNNYDYMILKRHTKYDLR